MTATNRELAQDLADKIIALEPMVVGYEVLERTNVVRLTLPKGLGLDVDLTHLRRGDADLVARRVVKIIRRR